MFQSFLGQVRQMNIRLDVIIVNLLFLLEQAGVETGEGSEPPKGREPFEQRDD